MVFRFAAPGPLGLHLGIVVDQFAVARNPLVVVHVANRLPAREVLAVEEWHGVVHALGMGRFSAGRPHAGDGGPSFSPRFSMPVSLSPDAVIPRTSGPRPAATAMTNMPASTFAPRMAATRRRAAARGLRSCRPFREAPSTAGKVCRSAA